MERTASAPGSQSPHFSSVSPTFHEALHYPSSCQPIQSPSLSKQYPGGLGSLYTLACLVPSSCRRQAFHQVRSDLAQASLTQAFPCDRPLWHARHTLREGWLTLVLCSPSRVCTLYSFIYRLNISFHDFEQILEAWCINLSEFRLLLCRNRML